MKSTIALIISLTVIHLTICYASGPLQGYILYCPCMGRFGNQAEQLLGTLLFAKLMNRTLILPPFIQYGSNHSPELIPFNKILQLEPIKNYHDVILLADFMKHQAKSVWPVGDRRFYCYSQRGLTPTRKPSCNALQGEPFYTFWNSFGVSEDSSTHYKPLTTSPENVPLWNEKYPPSSHQVLTFVGAPSPFPAHEDSIKLQGYVKFSKHVKEASEEYINSMNISGKPYLSVHIRHASDWKKACQLLLDGPKNRLFSSSQCTGYSANSGYTLEYETCFPSHETIRRDLNEALETFRAEHNLSIEIVHIATDYDSIELFEYLEKNFTGINFVKLEPSSTMFKPEFMIDLFMMTHANVFIGNCVSSFTAFSARIRKTQLNLDTYYFNHKSVTSHKDEL